MNALQRTHALFPFDTHDALALTFLRKTIQKKIYFT
jgi:hypothetical protein